MKILFLCGSLESGHDGVGDYTRKLAGEVIRQGHESSIIAINDTFTRELRYVNDSDIHQVIETLRMPTSLRWKRRMELIQKWIHEHDPDWISLQYVCFSFQGKGLPFLLARRLKRISEGRRWHIMFHELWVREDTFKFKVLAALQRRIVKNMIHRINALLVHTHLPLYYEDLACFSIQVQKLPLFSNFTASSIAVNRDEGVFRVAFFNLATQEPKIIAFLLKLFKETVLRNLDFEILMIGGAEESLKCFGNKLEELREFKNKVRYTGFLTNEMVTTVLSTCDVGVTPLSLSVIGKSGTSAAFLSQGIPLAVPLVDNLVQPFFDAKLLKALLFEPDLDKLYEAAQVAENEKKTISLSRIAEMFLDDLKLHYN